MSKVYEIEKILKDNTLRLRLDLPYTNMINSNVDVKEIEKNSIAVEIGMMSKNTGRILLEQVYEEKSLVIQAECVILHPDTAQRIIDLLKNPQ